MTEADLSAREAGRPTRETHASSAGAAATPLRLEGTAPSVAFRAAELQGTLQTLGPVTFDMTYAFLQLLDESFIVSVSYSDPIDNCSYTATDVGYQNK